jgi:osmoprotectant transport system permease protein
VRPGVLALLLLIAGVGAAAEPIRIGSKNFNESYLLGEMLAQLLEGAGYPVERRFGLGGTMICFEALTNGEIDGYVEYTGTLSQAILKRPDLKTRAAINREIAGRGIELLGPLGFNNTYAIAVRRDLAGRLGLSKIGDIAEHPALEIAVSHELLERRDGWPGLAETYDLPRRVQGIEHGLAYQAIADGAIDITDAYSTDGELPRYKLQVLEDDRGYFPGYLAAPLVRSDLPAPVKAVVDRLEGRLDEARMQALNAQVAFEGRSFADVANAFLVERGLASAKGGVAGLWPSLLANTLRHLWLTLLALASAVVAGVGLSLLVFRSPVLSRTVVYLCGLLQTIPSIALLALMIPVFGIGVVPAIVALFLYSLLPIVRNTVTALTTVDPTLARVALGMGLSERQRLRYLYLPLALPGMLAGIRTAAVICIGTATLAAFIGAGGLGDPIVTGLALNDVGLILQGAIPAASLAVLTELAFEGVERLALPGHLRSTRQPG